MSDGLAVDPLALREEVKSKYRAVAVDPHGSYHFHTGRPLTRRLGYDEALVAALQTAPLRLLPVSVTRSCLATAMRLLNVEFRQGVIEDLPIEDGSADVVISNGVINLCADKRQVFAEVMRVLKPGGRLQFADIANGKEVPAGALRNIDLWTD
jgi:arsenite methyltransferase